MSVKEKWILTHFYDVAYNKKIPVQVQIELLTNCNLRCKHCYIPKHNKMGLSTEQVKNIVLQLREMGTVSITFTGGEVFLRDDIVELIAFVRKQNMRVSILSNMTCITEEQVKQIADLCVTDISTTMFAEQASVHDYITSVDGSLKKLKENLQLLKKYGIRTLVKMPLMKMNYKYISEVEQFCKENGFNFSASPVIYPKLDGDKGPKEYRIPEDQLSVVIAQVDKLDNYVETHKVVNRRYDTICSALSYSFTIDSFGDVFPCTSFPYKLGNVNEKSVKDIWENSEELQYLRSISKKDLVKCEGCTVKEYCERCPGNAMVENGNVIECDPMAIMIAKARCNNYCEKML